MPKFPRSKVGLPKISTFRVGCAMTRNPRLHSRKKDSFDFVKGTDSG